MPYVSLCHVDGLMTATSRMNSHFTGKRINGKSMTRAAASAMYVDDVDN